MKAASFNIIVVAFGNAVIYFGLYLGFTNNAGFRELITGGAVAIISTIATLVFSSAGKVCFRFRLRDILQAWHLPWNIIEDTLRVLQSLGKQLFTRRGAASFIGAVAVDLSKHNSPIDAGRRALEVIFSTSTPNLIVIGIIEEQKVLLYHQIKREKISAMTRNLGVRS